MCWRLGHIRKNADGHNELYRLFGLNTLRDVENTSTVRKWTEKLNSALFKALSEKQDELQENVASRSELMNKCLIQQ